MDLTSTDEFKALRRLASQLNICSLEEKTDVSCVLLINEISDCNEIRELLQHCFSFNSKHQEPELPFVLTELVEACENAMERLIDDYDKLDEISKWMYILKQLDYSYLAHKPMWIDAKWPLYLELQLTEEIGDREKSDAIRKVMVGTPKFRSLLPVKTPEEKYQTLIDQMVTEMFDLDPKFAEKAVPHAIESKPDKFKFSTDFFDMLFDLEEYFSYRRHVVEENGEFVRHFYAFEFFAYQHASNPRKVCQTYANLGRYEHGWPEIRSVNSAEAYNFFCWKIFNFILDNSDETKFDEETSQLFNWLYVIWPDSPFAEENLKKTRYLPQLYY